MNMLMFCAGRAPAVKLLVLPSRPEPVTRTPGASAARSRKLRSTVGSELTCSRETFVATSVVLVSRSDGATIATAVSCAATALVAKSMDSTSPICTRWRLVCGSMPIRRSVSS